MKWGALRAVAALAIVTVLAAAGPAAAQTQTTVLYDGAVAGQTPADQGYFSYQTRPSPPAATTLTYGSGGAVLNSLGDSNDYAVFASPGAAQALPPLNRTAGYTLTWTAQVRSEAHTSNDRAGFSLLLLGSDNFGIEVACWEDTIWVQNDGVRDQTPGQAIFTRGEGAAFDTTAAPAVYTLVVKDSGYRLLANGNDLFSGPLRRYQPSLQSIIQNPARQVYLLSNVLFLGDNTGQAGAEVLLTRVALETVRAPQPPPPDSPPAKTPRAYLPSVTR